MRARLKRIVSVVSPALFAGLTLVACLPGAASERATPTAWPTLAALGTAAATNGVSEPRGIPRLIDHIRVDIAQDAVAVFPMEGHADLAVRIEVMVLSGEVDPTLVISNKQGDQLATSQRGGVGVPEVIGQFQFPVDGYYELGIGSASGSGQVGVSIYQLTGAQIEGGGEFAATDQKLTGSLKQPASYQSYHLPLQRGKRVDIAGTAEAEGLKLHLELFDPDGALLKAPVDDTGISPTIWNFMPSESGDYTVVVSNGDDHTGDYALVVSPSTSGGEAAINSRAIIALTAAPRRSAWLTVTGQALNGIFVDARPIDAGVDIVISITDPFGHLLTTVNSTGAGGNEQVALAQFPFDGPYQVEFSTRGDSGKIQYYIRPIALVDAKVGGKIYPGGRAEHGDIFGAGTVIAYTFDAKAGDLIGVDAHATGGTGLDLGFDLYDPDGQHLVSRDDVIGKDPVLDQVRLDKSGRYVLTLWNYLDTSGPYEIYVTSPEAPASVPGGN